MTQMYYDKAGRAISDAEWIRLFEDKEYCRVGSTDVGPYWVSTVWLGLDHSFMSEGSPIIFETMVFSRSQRDDPEDRGLTDIDGRRYATLDEALAGHEETVLMIEATLQTEEDVLPSAHPIEDEIRRRLKEES